MRYLLPVAALAALAGCGSGGDGSSAGSCADLVTLAGTDYLGTGNPAGGAGGPQLGEDLGSAVKPACDDGGSESGVVAKREKGTAYTLIGVDKKWAIAFGTSPSDVMIYVVNGPEIPAEVRAQLDPPTSP